MKKFILPLFVLITMSSAFAINVNTQVSWNSAVIEAALADGGIRRDTDSRLFNNIMNDLLQRDRFSISEAIYVCKEQCFGLQDPNLCSAICETFGNSLVKQNNKYNDFANRGYMTKENCEGLGTLAIWLDYYNACVPRDLCGHDDSWLDRKIKGKLLINYKAWCIEDFQYTQVRHVKYAEQLASSYLKNMIGENVGVNCHVDIPEAGPTRSVGGDNYIPCTTNDGRYFVFKFDDTTESFAGTPKYAFQGLCKSLQGRVFDDVCKGVTRAQCEIIDKQLDPIFTGDDDTEYNDVTGDCKWD